jgi:hypothetical protein
MRSVQLARRLVPVLGALAVSALIAGPAFAHEERDVNGYSMEVGLIDEPVYIGQRSGLEILVNKDEHPVEGLEKTLQAEVIYGSAKRPLPLTARQDQPGAYESVFIPTAAGKYTFHITGTLPDGSTMDESFTSTPTGFNEVQEQAAGQFPTTLPAVTDVAAQAQKGADAAGQVTLALGLGAVGVLLGLAALGVSIAGRSRAR